MRLNSKRAVSMLIAVVLWTAAPLIACVPVLRAEAKANCCAVMAMPGCSGGSVLNGSCCELAPAPNTAALLPSSLPEHGQHVDGFACEAYLPSIADPEAGQPAFHETPPFDPSPGGLSVLRI